MSKLESQWPTHKAFFDSAFEQLKTIGVNAALSATADSLAANRKLAEFLAESRNVIESEAVQVIDAMTLAFDGKAEKLKTLKAATDRVSAEAAFMKSALNTIETKITEIERLTTAIDALSASMQVFKALVDDGTLDKAAKAAASIRD